MPVCKSLLLLSAVLSAQGFVDPGGKSKYDDDQPETPELVHVTWSVPRDSSRRLRADRSSAPENLDINFAAAGAQFELRLTRNRALLPRSFRHLLHRADGSTEEGPTPQSCYYIGDVLGDEGGSAGISACDGSFRGLVIAHGRVVTLEPKQVVMPAAEETPVSKSQPELSTEDAWVEPLLAAMKDNIGKKEHVVQRMLDRTFLDRQTAITRFVHGGLDDTASFGKNMTFQRRLTGGSSVKYVEIALSNDNERYKTFNGNTADLAKQSADLMNSVTTMYRTAPSNGATFPHAIQVVLVAQHTFLEEDPWKNTVKLQGAETDSGSLLGLWNEWAFTQTQSGGMTPHDNHVLLSGRDFEGATAGLAGVSQMCNMPRSGNVNMCVKGSNLATCAAIVAHEIGHNFGMHHDSSGNACPKSGLIMNAVLSSPPTQFSDCSATYMTNFFRDSYAENGECLENSPTLVYGDPVCKNGFVEKGEDCDCGAADCSGKDACCNGQTCRFAQPSYQCSASAGACCENCMIVAKSSAKTCRAQRNSCDIAETCPGTSVECPRDQFVYPGQDCTISGFTGKCFAGTCSSMNHTCSVNINRDFNGSWDLTEPCAVSNDLCQNVVCHKRGEDEYECGQSFSTHGKQMSVPDGTPCWFPSMPGGTRTGMCSSGSCKLPHSLAEVPLCGNGGIDFGEECDCGATADPCCECSTCKLKSGKQCSSHEPCCTSGCTFKAAGEVCRAATGECDEEEVCAGSTGDCPPDVGKKWGTACKDSTGQDSTCYAKKCLDGLSEQCKKAYPERPTAIGDLSYHQCTGLMCCNSQGQCQATESTRSFTVNGKTSTIYIGGAFDGTVLSDSTKLCRGWESVTPETSCAQGQFLDASIGQCVACSDACQACNGPTSFDCVGQCKYTAKDSRGACALTADQAKTLSQSGTTSASPGAGAASSSVAATTSASPGAGDASSTAASATSHPSGAATVSSTAASATSISSGAGDTSSTVASATSISSGAGDASSTTASATSISSGAGDASSTAASATSISSGAGDASSTAASGTSTTASAGTTSSSTTLRIRTVRRAKVTMVVNSIVYTQLMANETLKTSLVNSVKAQIAALIAGISPEHVEVTLSAGSVQVDAVVTPPSGVSADTVNAAIGSADDFGTNMAAAIGQIPGIGSVASGPISVANVTSTADPTTTTTTRPIIANAVVQRCGQSFPPMLIFAVAASFYTH